MKMSGKCPKCQSDDIIRVDGFSLDYDLGEGIGGSAVYSKININKYVCCYCGYAEDWIEEDDIERIINSKRTQK